MIMRANVVVRHCRHRSGDGWPWTQSSVTALGSVFNASFTAAKELFNIFLVIRADGPALLNP